MQCDATDGVVDKGTWKLRTTFPIYVVAIGSIIGMQAWVDLCYFSITWLCLDSMV